MENKRTTLMLVIVILLVIVLIAVSYFYNNYNKTQIELLTKEANKILESNLVEDNIDFNVKTDKNYAKVENAIKEYISKLKNIYVEMNQMVSGINPNTIFSAQNMPDKKMDEIENIIIEYKEKSQNLILEYEELISLENISDNITESNFSIRNDYYIDLYNEVMLSDTMKKQYNKLEEEIKNEKANLYDKLNKVEKMKNFLKEYEDSWSIKDNKVYFNNVNKITEYYNLFNQIVD